MKFNFLLTLTLFISVASFSQNNQKVLFTIDDDPVYTDEFVTVYKKNQNLIVDSSKNDVESYLELFVAYKLKVQQAKELKLDTLQEFKNELKQYKSKLVSPYLKDEEVTDKLVHEVYDRLQKEVNVSHILIFLKPEATPKDTLEAYNKLIEARNLILAGDDFSTIAKQYSQDQSVAQNGGEIGYFSAMQMVYPFENVAFSTPIDDVSMPFRTKFGYHILIVNDIRISKGEVEVAHIMLKKGSVNAEQRIDSIYTILEEDSNKFERLANELSEDRASANNGGKLNKFRASQMVEDFSNVAFSLETVGEISKPFQTQYGWHIIKLIQKYPLESFEVMEEGLKQKVENEERSNLISKSVVDRLLKEYNVVVFNESLNQFKVDDWKLHPEKFQKTLIQIEDEEIKQDKFIAFLKTAKNTPVEIAFKGFEQREVLKYFTDNIELTNEEFAATYKEFKEGMLLFEMLEKQIWEKSKDSIGLSNYYNDFKSEKYTNKDLENNRGSIISDYQTYLEKEWVKELQEKYKVKFNKGQKKYIFEAKLD